MIPLISIVFDEMNVDSLFNNAAIGNGVNKGFGWDSHLKQNYNLNLTELYTPILYEINILVDNDVFERTVNR